VFANFISHHIGLPVPMDHPQFDRHYVESLLRHVQTSSAGKVVILAHEHVRDEYGNIVDSLGSLYVPNDYVFALAEKHPVFLPGVSIHPARPDALDELQRCVDRGAVLMKCLPNCQNIDCSEPRYTRFWEKMAQCGLPLLAHTGGEHTVPVVNAAYANPERLRLPLQCGVKVIAAHCGTRSGFNDPDYFPTFVQMTREFKHFYGDTSAFSFPIRGKRIRECLREPLTSRLVHGSDYPVPVHGIWAWLQGFVRWRDYLASLKIPSLLERDIVLKRAMGFDGAHFTRVNQLLRLKDGENK
jgi:predicted TIM-barrel fold metal-dependent hydrolase